MLCSVLPFAVVDDDEACHEMPVHPKAIPSCCFKAALNSGQPQEQNFSSICTRLCEARRSTRVDFYANVSVVGLAGLFQL